jgi:hypothetical protein
MRERATNESVPPPGITLHLHVSGREWILGIFKKLICANEIWENSKFVIREVNYVQCE